MVFAWSYRFAIRVNVSKILLKHKKLPDGADEILQKFEPSGAKQDFDIASSVKNGILYVRDRWVIEILTGGVNTQH